MHRNHEPTDSIWLPILLFGLMVLNDCRGRPASPATHTQAHTLQMPVAKRHPHLVLRDLAKRFQVVQDFIDASGPTEPCLCLQPSAKTLRQALQWAITKVNAYAKAHP